MCEPVWGFLYCKMKTLIFISLLTHKLLIVTFLCVSESSVIHQSAAFFLPRASFKADYFYSPTGL